MVQRQKSTHLAFILTAILGISCETASTYSGICEGYKDGEIYQLLVLNFTTERVYFQVDGRPVANIPSYNTTDHVPGYRDLETFPQCVESKLTVTAGESLKIQVGQLIGDILVTTEDFVELSPNGCYLSARVFFVDGQPPQDWIDFGYRLPTDYLTKTEEGTSCFEEPTPPL